jgi:hypothetical protein
VGEQRSERTLPATPAPATSAWWGTSPGNQGLTLLSWKALKEQFGQGFGRLDHFRRQFKQTLDLALSVYPAAKVEVHERGVTLLPSPAPVATKAVRLAATGGRALIPRRASQ